MAAKKLPNEVTQLVEYLRSSGTGEGKLKAIEDLAKSAPSPDAFLDGLEAATNSVTAAKAKAYLLNAFGIGKVVEVRITKKSDAPSVAEVLEQLDKGSGQEQQLQGDKTLDEQTEEPTDVTGLNVAEASEVIGRMKSVPKLEIIGLTDNRVTVQKAVEARLTELSKPNPV